MQESKMIHELPLSGLVNSRTQRSQDMIWPKTLLLPTRVFSFLSKNG